jgi:DNA polymerase III subunit delta
VPPRSRAKATTSADPTSAPVVVLTGKEFYLVERAVEQVLAARRASDPEVERRIVAGGSDAGSAPGDLSEALTPTLFGDAAVILVTDVDQFEDAGQATLLTAAREIASGAREGLSLLVHHPAGVKARKLLDTLRALPGAVVIECAPLKYRAVDEFVAGEFARLRRRVDSDAVQALRTAVGDDLRSLSRCAEQLCSDVEDGTITAEHVALYHAGVADVPGYEVADAVWDAHPEQLVRRVRWALENDPGATPALTGATAASLRALVRYAEARHLPEAEAARAAGVPPFKIRALAGQLRKWTPATLAVATRLLAAADLSAKGQTPDGRGLENSQRQHAVESALLRVSSRRLGDETS